MSDPAAADTGFLPRVLLCEPPSTIGTRVVANARSDEAEREAFTSRLREILDTPMPADPETRELHPRMSRLSREARALLSRFADAVEEAQAPGGDLAHITGAASKSAEQAARIAGVLTLFADISAREVTGATAAGAAELAQYYLGEASRLASAAVVSAEIDKAESLRRWLLEIWHEPEVMVRDVVQFGPGALRESPKARAALGVLEAHGWITRL
jgi:hypothetical protein